ncbi:hypothetical protein ACHAPU_010992 [Fusarium lateritium]
MVHRLTLAKEDTNKENTNTNNLGLDPDLDPDLDLGLDLDVEGGIEMVPLGGNVEKAMLVEVIRIVVDGKEMFSNDAGKIYDHPSFTPLEKSFGQPAETVYDEFEDIPLPLTIRELHEEMMEGMRYVYTN